MVLSSRSNAASATSHRSSSRRNNLRRGASSHEGGGADSAYAQRLSCRTVTVSSVLTRIEDCIPALRRYAAALLRNREEADDLVHDCLVRALDKLHTRREDADVRAWLFAIMHNLFISQLRRSKARPSGERLTETHESI